MKRIMRTAVVCCVLILFCTAARAGEKNSGILSIPGMVRVSAQEQVHPPEWAVMERRLISAMEDAAPEFLKRYTRRGGTPYGEGPYDDVYEMFFNWPLFYAIGADEELLDIAVDEYNAITRHCTVYDPLKKTITISCTRNSRSMTTGSTSAKG